MNTISSQDLDQCIKYSDIEKISGLGYASFLRCLVSTMEKGMPVELLDSATDEIFKAHILQFSIDYKENEEGEQDNLNLELKLVESEIQKTLSFMNIGKFKVKEDKKSGPRSFYRYYVRGENNKNYRFTFNRRISKNS